jgi:hypothetical protein
MSKLPKTTQIKTVEVVSAIVEPDTKGINIRVENEKGELEGYFVPLEAWGRIPPDKDPALELEKIARIFNGYRESHDGDWEPIENFKRKKINIETQS